MREENCPSINVPMSSAQALQHDSQGNHTEALQFESNLQLLHNKPCLVSSHMKCHTNASSQLVVRQMNGHHSASSYQVNQPLMSCWIESVVTMLKVLQV